LTLKEKLRSRELVLGCFIKTPHPVVVEVLGMTDLDCLVLDAEHAPFDRSALDACILGARAAGKDILVRPQCSSPEHILNALDLGATGVLLPHIRSAAVAAAALHACHYGAGGRGYAGSTRAAGYTTHGLSRTRAEALDVAVIAQIEDVDALDQIDAIAADDRIDALFVGRADLTVALGADGPDATEVVGAVERICSAASEAGRCVGMFLSRQEDVALWRSKGASLFLMSSDHEFLLKGASALREKVSGRR
jgi:2-keto-3-deoxy-L-rhamnonate aldolase RhmA